MCQFRLLLPSADRDRRDRLLHAIVGAENPGRATAASLAAALIRELAADGPVACLRLVLPASSPPLAPALDGALDAGEVALAWRRDDHRHAAAILPRATLTAAWIRAEELLTHLRSLDPPRPASIGVASSSVGGCPARLVEQAEAAMTLARTRGGDRVCTWDMIELVAAARGAAGAHLGVEARRHRLLARLSTRLGPTQREHLTSHSERVAALAASLARWMGHDPRDAETARLAGLFHDIGKAAVPEDLLAKPSALTPAERSLIDRHADEGAALGEALGLDARISSGIRHHHARFDAAPCCQGRPGDLDAPPTPSLPASIVSVADAYVAMTSDRPYRAACTPAVALAELSRHRGRQFDPVVADAAIAMLTAHARAAA